DDESKPENGPQNAERLIKRDGVDVLIGTVHSGVQMGIHKVVGETGTLTIIPNAGANTVTRQLCTKNVFRTSFSNWQPAHGMGLALGKKGVKKAAWITWDYAAGKEAGEGFREGLEKHGGKVVQTLTLKFPETNFQPLLAQVPGLDVEAVGTFFAGGGAVQFVKEYKAAGLKVPLCGSGFLTEGTLEAQGDAAEGIETALHYGDGLDNAKNKAFREAFKAKTQRDADVYAVQGYDAAQLLAVGLDAVKGDLDAEANLYKAMRAAKIDSPRGPISISPSQDVVHNIYLRRAEKGENKVIGIAAEALADPGTGCKL
ncbi:MAG: ABC transporter substrate-binding protein, partial [Hyphomicrobiaceae bacterium]